VASGVRLGCLSLGICNFRGKRHRPQSRQCPSLPKRIARRLAAIDVRGQTLCVAIRQIWLVGLRTSLGDRFGWGRSMMARPSHSSEQAPREEQALAAWRNTPKIYVFPHIGPMQAVDTAAALGVFHQDFRRCKAFTPMRFACLSSGSPFRASQNSYDPGADLDRQLRASAAERVAVPAIDAEDCFDPAARIQPQRRNADGLDHILYRQQSGIAGNLARRS
jgi:hypothetical protein